MDGILSSLLLLHDPEDVIEIRSIDPKPTISGLFTANSANIEKQLARYKGRTFYQTMNCIDPGCYSRAQREVLMPNPKETTSDRDIIGYSWILIDADPVRPSGVSATDGEKEQARKTARAVYLHLKKLGFSEPIAADSGNGYHLLYKIKAEISSKDIISQFLKVLDLWFSSEAVQIDTAVYNPARITKLYGTVARKGANSPERPHRESKILHAPNPIQPTPMALVRAVAGEWEKMTPSSTLSNRYASTPFDMDSFLASHNISVARKIESGNLTKYILSECPFNSDHKAPDSAVFVSNDGRLGFKCFHNGCSGFGWHEFRAKVDPSAYSNSVFQAQQVAPLPRISNGSEQVSQVAASAAAVQQSPTVVQKPTMLDIADVEDYDRSKITTIQSKLGKLDALIGGFNKGELSIWSGSNSSGKSTLVSQLGLTAVHQGYKVAMFSGEMPPKLVKYWLYLQAAGRDNVEEDPLSPRHYRLKTGIKEYLNKRLSGSLAIYNNDYGSNWETVASVIFNWVKEKGSDVVIIDNLMSLNLPVGTSDKYEIQSQIVQTLSQAAKQLNVHIHFICHPRKTESFLRKNDISGTGDLSNTADNVFMVHRVNNDFLTRVKEIYPKLNIAPDVGNAIEIMKNRDLGVVDEMILLYFDGTCKTMTDIRGGVPAYSWAEGFTQVDMNEIEGFPFKEGAGNGTESDTGRT